MSSDNAQASSAVKGGSENKDGCVSGSNSRVNAIWQQLKSAHGGPKTPGVNIDKLWHGFISDPIQGKVKAGTKPANEPCTYQPQLIDRATQGTLDSASKPLQPQPQRPAAGSKPDADTALQLVARCVAGLKDSSQAARRKALQDVQSQLLDNPALSEKWLTERLEQDGLGKALLRRFDDPSDTCREMAVTGLLRLLQAAPQAVLSLLPYAFPVISERVRHREEGTKNLTEPCEEVRLALARLLHALVSLAGKSFGGYAGEAVELVAALCEDPFHEVQEKACAVVVALNEVLGLRLQPVAKQLVAVVLPLTTAKRHRVRIAALQALRPTMHQGAHEMILEMVAWRDPNVIPIKAFYGDDLKVNFCGKLAADPHPAVRREFLGVLADWMTQLRERMDHESRLLPFVLSALNDEAPEIQADAVGLLERLGAQYEQDHEKDIKDTLSYLPEEAHGIGWQAPGAAGYVYGAITAGEETVNGGRAVFVLPGPLRSRPRLGTRRLVQTNFGRIAGVLSEEVTSWLLEARRRAAALLRTELVLVEEWSEQHLHLVMPALCKAISDPEVRPLIRDCCAIIGAFTDPELALQLLQPRVTDEVADLTQRAAALEVLACVIRGAGPRRAMDAHLSALLDLLSLESLLSSEDTRIRRALLEIMEQLLATCGPACGRQAFRLLWVCLHLRAPGRAPTAQTGAGPGPLGAAEGGAAAAVAAVPGCDGDTAGAVVEAVLLPRLAEACGFSGGVDEIIDAHRRELLEKLDPGSSPNVLLATGVLCRLLLPYSSLSYLLYLPEESLGRVLPPEPLLNCRAAATIATSTAAITMEVDENDSMVAADTAVVAAAMEEDVGENQRATGMASPSGQLHTHAHWYWHPDSTTAVLSHLQTDLDWLPRQQRCATMCFISLEACLANLPGPLDGPAVERLTALLCRALGACHELTQLAVQAVLRCTLTALVRRQLLSDGGMTLVACQVGELVQQLANCMAVVSSSACRLQACYVMEMLVQSPGARMVLLGDSTAVLTAVCAAVSARLYDAADEVRCASLSLARQVVKVVMEDGRGRTVGALELSGGGAVARLLAEIAQLRDVAPGSGFYDEYHAFRAWMERHGKAEAC
ncbi:hypothetical protein VaNZ11_013291 [Volvox africanus]|uniref:TOG domain-containing protein n=1 Tax=Volvox africanus TaxID=51714 RepID=A0ABQ5SHB8_9CHLO|nr:hypothetical protein VaNZ11_013291 [Volvox africanus]